MVPATELSWWVSIHVLQVLIHISHAQEKEFQCEQYGIVPYNSNKQGDGLCKYSKKMV